MPNEQKSDAEVVEVATGTVPRDSGISREFSEEHEGLDISGLFDPTKNNFPADATPTMESTRMLAEFKRRQAVMQAEIGRHNTKLAEPDKTLKALLTVTNTLSDGQQAVLERQTTMVGVLEQHTRSIDDLVNQQRALQAQLAALPLMQAPQQASPSDAPNTPIIPTINIPLKFELPTFSALPRDRPTRFLRNLEEYISARNVPAQQIRWVISNALKGAASEWWLLLQQSDPTFEEFKRRFCQRYWGESTQHKVRIHLSCGHYNPAGRQTMAEYAISQYNNATDLEPPLSQPEILRLLSRHFSPEIRAAILVRSISSIDELIQLLEGFDEAEPVNNRMYDRRANNVPQYRNSPMDTARHPAQNTHFSPPRPHRDWGNQP